MSDTCEQTGVSLSTEGIGSFLFGKSCEWEFKGHNITNVLGCYFQHIIGLQQEITLGAKHETVVGFMVGTGLSYSYKRWYGNENHVNFAKFRQQCRGKAVIDGDDSITIIGGTDGAVQNTSMLLLDDRFARFEHQGVKIHLMKGGTILIDNNAGSTITLKRNGITLSCKSLTFACDEVDFTNAELKGGKDGGLFP